jgi:hypothetical protein
MNTFVLSLSVERTLSLACDGRKLPVNEPYLWRLSAERGMALDPGEERTVDASFAKNAIEEALAQVSHDIEQARSLRTRLLGAYLDADAVSTRAA